MGRDVRLLTADDMDKIAENRFATAVMTLAVALVALPVVALVAGLSWRLFQWIAL